jgi:hypothetical protein
MRGVEQGLNAETVVAMLEQQVQARVEEALPGRLRRGRQPFTLSIR